MLTDPKRVQAAKEIAILLEKYRELRDLYKVGNGSGVFVHKPGITTEQRKAVDDAADKYFKAKAIEAPQRRQAETIQMNNDRVERTGQGMYL
jgi:hypothetical protein